MFVKSSFIIIESVCKCPRTLPWTRLSTPTGWRGILLSGSRHMIWSHTRARLLALTYKVIWSPWTVSSSIPCKYNTYCYQHERQWWRWRWTHHRCSVNVFPLLICLFSFIYWVVALIKLIKLNLHYLNMWSQNTSKPTKYNDLFLQVGRYVTSYPILH